MSEEQIARFIEQSVKLKKRWFQISVLGGEPTLHPHLDQILLLLRKYRDEHSRNTRIVLVTNGYGAVVSRKLDSLPSDIIINNTGKTSRDQDRFSTSNIAPRDMAAFEGKDFCEGCIVPELCGMALTRYGYYTCGAGASVDRVFGFGVGVRELAEVTPERVREQRRALCGYCGHFKDWGLYTPANPDTETWPSGVSPAWAKAYADYRLQPPALQLF